MKKLVLIFLLLPFSLFLFADGNIQVDSFSLNWKVQGSSAEFTLTAETEGWLAVGFNPSRMMKDADIKIGYVDSSGEVTLEDHFGNSNFSHRSDERMGGTVDVEILGGEEIDGSSTIRFRIPLNSGDDKDQPLVPGATVKLIFAMGKGDNLRVKHVERTSVEVTF